MSNNSETDYGDYCFSIKEFASGKPFIMFEPRKEKLKILGNGFLGFEFNDDVSFEEAEKIATSLNKKIKCVLYTWFID